MVVKELAAKLQIELAAKLGDPLPNVGGLGVQIFLIVKSDLVAHIHPGPRRAPSLSFRCCSGKTSLCLL